MYKTFDKMRIVVATKENIAKRKIIVSMMVILYSPKGRYRIAFFWIILSNESLPFEFLKIVFAEIRPLHY